MLVVMSIGLTHPDIPMHDLARYDDHILLLVLSSPVAFPTSEPLHQQVTRSAQKAINALAPWKLL